MVSTTRLLPPSAPSLKQLPVATLKATALGLIAGPMLGLLLRGLNRLIFGRQPFETPGTPLWFLHAVWSSGVYAVTFYVLCALPAQFVRRQIAGMSPGACVALTAGTGLSGGILAYITASALIGGRPSLVPLSRVTLLDGFVVMGIVTAVSAWNRRVAEKALVAARAQSKVLQAQINPHFFFNTLNTISALIPLDPSGAQQTIGYLADMSRYAFASTELETVPLAQEIEFARAYLEIERARYGNRLRFELPSAADMEGLRLPPLSIQPLAENAVRYGVAKRLDGGAVSIRVQRNGARFSVSVDNDTEGGTNIAEATFFQSSHALMNIRNRLRLIYKETASIEVSAPRPHTVSVTIRALTPVS